MSYNSYYLIFILTITVLACFLRKKYYSEVSHPCLPQSIALDPLGGFSPTRPPAAIGFGFTKTDAPIFFLYYPLFVILSFAWMLYFHVLYDFRIREKIWVNTIISLYCSKYSCVSLLEPGQNNLGNPEAYLEPCLTSKMDCFAKIVTSWMSLKVVNYSCKALHLRFLTEFWIRLCHL